MPGSLERFQALIENSSDAISLVNPEGQVLYASASTSRVLGYEPGELLGRNGLDLVHPQDRDHTVQTLKHVVAEPALLRRTQVRVRQKDGQWRWVETTASNLLDEPHVGAIVVNYREIEASRAEEEQRRHFAEGLARSNAELRAFAHTAAHDLKEPLRTISSFTQLLVQKAQLAQGDEEIAEFIVDGVARMSRLLDHLLSSAIQGFHETLHPVDLENVADQAIRNLKEALTSSNAAVTIEALPTVQGQECDLVRVFQNLLSNAVKYRTDAAPEVHIAAEQFGADWVIKIRDNGIGIRKEHHRRVFGLFTRLHADEIPGTGIGLAVCKEIVEGLGGTIWVESEPGAGSTFCFTLAASQDTSEVILIPDAANGSKSNDPD